MKIRHFALVGALTSSAFVGGCGGGNGNGVPTSTPIPTPTFIGPSTGSPNQPTITIPRTLLRLPSGQIAALDLTRSGGLAQGSLRVFNGMASNSSLDAGVYAVSGAFAAPSTFNVQGPETEANRFTIAGNLPAGGFNSDLTFTQGKFTGKGTLLSSNQQPILASTAYVATGDLRFTDFTTRGPAQLADYPFDLTPITPTGPDAFTAATGFPTNNGTFGNIVNGDTLTQNLRITGTRNQGFSSRRNAQVTVQITPAFSNRSQLLSAGQSYDLSASSGALVIVDLNGFNYLSNSGTLTITSLGPEAASFELKNVRVDTGFIPSTGDVTAFPTDGQPISTLLVNGTLAATGVGSNVSTIQ